jgi:hypothetical protein
MLPGLSLGSMEDGDNAAVAISLAVLQKGMAEFSLLRAPLDAPIYQMNEDIAALLLSSSAGSRMVEKGGAVGWPVARVSVMATKRRRTRLWGFLPVFIRRSTVIVESVVSNSGRDVALLIAMASSRASTMVKMKTRTSSSVLSARRGMGWFWAVVLGYCWAWWPSR